MPNSSDLSTLRWQAALADLIPSAAHQINGPLTALLGYAELLANSHECSPADRDENLQRLKVEAQRCADIVHRLHLLARPPSQDLPRRGLIQDAVASVHLLAASRLQRSHVILVTDHLEGLPMPQCDSGYVERAILGVLNCACRTAGLRAASAASPLTLNILGVCEEGGVVLEVHLRREAEDEASGGVAWCAESVPTLRQDLSILGVGLAPNASMGPLRLQFGS